MGGGGGQGEGKKLRRWGRCLEPASLQLFEEVAVLVPRHTHCLDSKTPLCNFMLQGNSSLRPSTEPISCTCRPGAPFHVSPPTPAPSACTPDSHSCTQPIHAHTGVRACRLPGGLNKIHTEDDFELSGMKDKLRVKKTGRWLPVTRSGKGNRLIGSSEVRSHVCAQRPSIRDAIELAL